jgi:hypothetical protein
MYPWIAEEDVSSESFLTYLEYARRRWCAVSNVYSWILEGNPSRVSIETFRKYYNAALHIGLSPDDPARNMNYDSEEMECLLANYINKVSCSRLFTNPSFCSLKITFILIFFDQGLIKGYISHAHQLVVLSKEKPFPP